MDITCFLQLVLQIHILKWTTILPNLLLIYLPTYLSTMIVFMYLLILNFKLNNYMVR